MMIREVILQLGNDGIVLKLPQTVQSVPLASYRGHDDALGDAVGLLRHRVHVTSAGSGRRVCMVLSAYRHASSEIRPRSPVREDQ